MQGENSGFSEWVRCFYDVACHAAELSYQFELERRLDCRDPSESYHMSLVMTNPLRIIRDGLDILRSRWKCS